MENIVLSAEGLGKTFTIHKRRIEAFRDVSLQAREKEVIGIMGPSGCGKSTLAKIVAGIETPTSGRLQLFGHECNQDMPKEMKRRIGYIFQEGNLLPWRTVEANLRFPLEIFGIDKQKEFARRVDEALEIVGLSKYRTCLPQELSGGMMHRVGIARALVLNPDLLVMDQPFGALDAITRKKLSYDFLHIFQQSQKTILIITNSIDEALLFSNRIYVFSDAPGTVQEVVDVNVPYAQRNQDITTNEQFTALRARMIRIIKRQYAGEAGQEGEA